MTKKHFHAGLILLLAGSILMTACSAQQTPTAAPAIDTNAIYTQAAQTVQAGLAQTPLPPTFTPAPTETQAFTPTMDPNQALALTATAQIVQPGGATATTDPQQPAATNAVIPTATTAAVIIPTTTQAVVTQPKTTGDKAELVGQVPGDGSEIPPSASFDVSLTFKNTGTTTWTKQYALKFYAGDRMGSPNDVVMTKEVAPGDSITLVFPMKADDKTGGKKTIWVLQNAEGVNFYSLWLETKVK